MRYLHWLLSTILLFVVSANAELVYVKRVIDGDTFEGNNGKTYRLLGVDTPETKHPTKGVEPYGREAFQFTKFMIEGKFVDVSYDSKSRTVDKYGRDLVRVSIDGIDLNSGLVITGYARVLTNYPISDDYLQGLIYFEEQAKMKREGIWSTSSIGKNGAETGTRSSTSARPSNSVTIIAHSISTSRKAREVCREMGWREADPRSASAVLVVCRSMLYNPLRNSYSSYADLNRDAGMQLNISGSNYHIYLYEFASDLSVRQIDHTSFEAKD
jgi:endonuclease YncB( thermonuclease family)